jgi:hypothetical protein
VLQHPFGKQGRQMLGGCRGTHVNPDVAVGIFLSAACGTGLNLVAETHGLQMPVEQGVDATVRGLLADEALYLVCKALLLASGQRFEASAHRVHKVLLALRKAHRQRVKKRRAKCIAAIPALCERCIQVDQ